MQLDKSSPFIEILVNKDTERVVQLGELIPDWWGEDKFNENATYNIWNSDVGMPLRSNQIFKEIVHLKEVFSHTLIFFDFRLKT